MSRTGLRLAALVLLAAGAARAGETPEARAAREKLEPYAQAFGIRLVALQHPRDAYLQDAAFDGEKEDFYQTQRCFRDGRDFDGACRRGQYLTPARFKASYEQAASAKGSLDHREGIRWYCGLVDASRRYFNYYTDHNYHGGAPSAVRFTDEVVNAESALLKESYGIDLVFDSHFNLGDCIEKVTDEAKRLELIPREAGPDEPHARGEPPAEPCAPTVYRGVEDLRRLQGEGNRFVWFSGTLWGSWTKDVESLALLLDCRGPRWVGTFVGAVPRDLPYTGGAVFNGCAVRHRDQAAEFKSIDWAKVKAPERKRACRELSRRLKR